MKLAHPTTGFYPNANKAQNILIGTQLGKV